MPTLYYVTHPQVQIDANVPVPEWGLSDIASESVSNARPAMGRVDPADRVVG